MFNFGTRGGGAGSAGVASIAVSASGQTVTDSTTLVSSTALTRNVLTPGVYTFLVEAFFTTVNTSGVKVAISGTATYSAIIYDVFIDSSTVLFSRATAKDTAVGVTTTGVSAHVTITGTATVSASGTLLLQFAQNAETGAAESVILLTGSTLSVTRLS